jgi:hypothetical protein
MISRADAAELGRSRERETRWSASAAAQRDGDDPGASATAVVPHGLLDALIAPT